MEINKIYNENCLETMAKMPDNFIDLTVTSPPYDDLRTYNGYCFDFENVAKELFRVTKQGGVVVWNVNDATKNGSETLTSLRQVLFFNQIGFNVETMIWEKTGSGCLGSNKFYGQNFEYMFILSKGKPKTFNMIKDRLNKSVGCKLSSTDRQKDGSLSVVDFSKRNNKEIKEYGGRFNIWEYKIGRGKIGDYSTHPAPFPEKLAEDHIISWSNEGDTVLDPFCGSGTTGKMAVINNRNFIGFDLSSDYCEIASTRIKKALL